MVCVTPCPVYKRLLPMCSNRRKGRRNTSRFRSAVDCESCRLSGKRNSKRKYQLLFPSPSPLLLLLLLVTIFYGNAGLTRRALRRFRNKLPTGARPCRLFRFFLRFFFCKSNGVGKSHYVTGSSSNCNILLGVNCVHSTGQAKM